MANKVKGLLVEIGGDTSGLQNALKKVNSATGTNMPNHYAQTVKPTTTYSLPHQVLQKSEPD